MALTPNERAARYRARQRGEDVPLMKRGPKKGFKQSPEHIAKRIRVGAEHHAWKGALVSAKSGRSRALRAFKSIGSCVLCGNQRAERHHKNGNTADNSPANIEIVCRRCHMMEDGRLEQFKELARRNQPKAVAARWR